MIGFGPVSCRTLRADGSSSQCRCFCLRHSPCGSCGHRDAALAVIGLLGLGWLVAQGLSGGLRGWNRGALEALFGPAQERQAFGTGAIGIALCFAGLIAIGLTERGALKGDAFVIGSIGLLVLLVATFVIYPIVSMFTGAFQDFDGSFTTAGVTRNIGDPQI